MKHLNVHEAKTHLSRYLDEVEKGETIILCRHNKPIAEIRPLEKPKPQRTMGIDAGKFSLGPEFFEPLPDDMLGAFNAKDE